jgi:hypothetical protein
MKPDEHVPEKVLYEIWKNQNFKNNLRTSDGNNISVLNTGTLNNGNAGPDFKNMPASKSEILLMSAMLKLTGIIPIGKITGTISIIIQ